MNMGHVIPNDIREEFVKRLLSFRKSSSWEHNCVGRKEFCKGHFLHFC